MRIFDIISEDNTIRTGDRFELELDDNLLIESTVVGFLPDGVVIQGDDIVLSYLNHTVVEGLIFNQLDEAEYQGRKVQLGKPMAGDVKKSKVYVKGPSGRVVKVNFGDKKMKIKKSNPKRRKSFRARHNCDNPGPRHKARYWSCRAWE